MFNTSVAMILGGIAALVLTIWLYVKVMPRQLDGSFDNPWWQRLHDFFHFKKLYLEEVLKFVYVLATIACVCAGIFMLVAYEEVYRYSYYSGSRIEKESTFLYGLCLIIAGPISLRLAYEVIMMFILLVKNTIEINNKLPEKKEEPEAPSDENQI